MKVAIVFGNDRTQIFSANVVEKQVSDGAEWLPGVRIVGIGTPEAMAAVATAEYAINESNVIANGWWPDGLSQGFPDFNVAGCGVVSPAGGQEIKAFAITSATRKQLEDARLLDARLPAGARVAMADGRAFVADAEGVLVGDDAHRGAKIGLGEYGSLGLLCAEESGDFEMAVDGLGLANRFPVIDSRLVDAFVGVHGIAHEDGSIEVPLVAGSFAEMIYDNNDFMELCSMHGCEIDDDYCAAWGVTTGEWHKAVEVALAKSMVDSIEEASKIAGGKGNFDSASLQKDREMVGKVIGVTDALVVLSLGRSATIFSKLDLSRVPEMNEMATIAIKGGKAVVADQRAVEVDRGR